MNTFIRGGLIGALIAVPLGFVGVLLVEGGPDVEGWALFAAMMATPVTAAIGFVLGGIWGTARASRDKTKPDRTR
jgi:hypothetical protein